MSNSKRLYLDVRSTQDKKTKGNAGLGNYAIELRSWVQKLIDGGEISLANSPTKPISNSLYSATGLYTIGVNSSTIPTLFDSSTLIPQTLSVNTSGNLMRTDTSALFVSNTQINPSSAGSPTRSEVRNFIVSQSASYQGAAKNRIIYYTGTDTATDDYTYAYYLTGDLKLFVIDKP